MSNFEIDQTARMWDADSGQAIGKFIALTVLRIAIQSLCGGLTGGENTCIEALEEKQHP